MSTIWYFLIWAAWGLAFWIDSIRWNGIPTTWKSQPRQDGWDIILGIYLPLTIVLGPCCWVLFLVFREKVD